MKMHSCWKRWQLVQRPSSDASKPEQRIYDLSVSTRGSGRMMIVNSLCASCSSGKRSLYAASVLVGCSSCAAEEHREGLVDVLDTCRRPEDDTCLDAAGVEVGVR